MFPLPYSALPKVHLVRFIQYLCSKIRDVPHEFSPLKQNNKFESFHIMICSSYQKKKLTCKSHFSSKRENATFSGAQVFFIGDIPV
jgi:hypothetical protein